jgi:hypothetical protein
VHAPKPGSTLWDLDEGRPIFGWIWVDVEKGLMEGYQLDESGVARTEGDSYLTYTARGRFQLTRAGAAPSRSAAAGVPQAVRALGAAPACVRCGDPLVLPGDDLCVKCKAEDRAYSKVLSHLETLKAGGKVPGAAPCAYRGCNRPGVYSVSHEVGVSSVDAGGPRVFRRGAAVARLYFCPWHWRPPLLLDPKGEVVEEQDHGFGVRP